MNRRLKQFLVGAGATVAVLALVVVVARVGFRRAGARDLDRVVRKLDAADPGWRLDAVLAAREKAAPPDDRNPAVVAARVRARYGPGWEAFRNARSWGGGPVSNHLPGFWATAWYLQAGTATADARAAARANFLRPEVAGATGFVPLKVPDNPFATLLPHAQDTRGVFDLLDLDARLAALEGHPDRGLAAARAGLAATRALGDEPFLISQLVRIAGATVAANAGVQVLGWGEPKAGLAEFQAALRAEADTPWLAAGLRGERAVLDRAFDGLENGTIEPREMLRMLGIQENPLAVNVALPFYRAFLPGDRAMALKLFTDMLDAANLPPHEQKAAFAAIRPPLGGADGLRYLVTRLCLPATGKMAEASVRARATLLTASAAVACERFRQARGRWPESLAEIPPDLLPPLPPDPYTGGPIQFRRTPDGVVVFTAADDLHPHRTFEQPGEADPMDGYGRGFRLWDVPLRGATKPAPEPPPLDPDDDPNP